VTLNRREGTVSLKRKHYIAFPGELTVEVAMNLSSETDYVKPNFKNILIPIQVTQTNGIIIYQ